MSAKLHLAKPEDLDRLAGLVARYHAFEGITQSEDKRRAALQPLLEGTPHGIAYLIGPRTAPVGYIVISFGYSVELGGIDGFVDEFFIREKLRGRGLGGEVLRTLLPALADHGVKALHLEVERGNERARGLYARLGFENRETYHLMTRILG
ncbi:GNAT family N-acetyltransferase [Pseudoruegeria sp. SHC-113]|uniref:GNAT family N-acetyltransferase n=1 Tax=Pseudoruegeria sp. SHC-113 TaxID=2855439 RepID=UPI0021BB8208|nr:GNAT family N-acetyltransferase [Pseudoruegeria sp. SHC-113]MCT8160867.1 GNAT family N-acetyltransferase [Pseudoruegeria sp. SHC-113]